MAQAFLQIDPDYSDHRRFRLTGPWGMHVFLQLLRRHRTHPNGGIVSCDQAHPETLWSKLLALDPTLSVEDMERARRLLADRGLIEIQPDGSVLIPGVDKWGQRMDRPKTEAERKAEYRDRQRRDVSHDVPGHGGTVPDCPASSRQVTTERERERERDRGGRAGVSPLCNGKPEDPPTQYPGARIVAGPKLAPPEEVAAFRRSVGIDDGASSGASA